MENATNRRDLTLPILAGGILVLLLVLGGMLFHSWKESGRLEVRSTGMKPGDLAKVSRLQDLQGRAVDLFGHGEYVLLCFFSRTCPVCVDESEFWRVVRKVGQRRGVKTFLVTTDTTAEELRRYVQAYGIGDLPLLYDPRGGLGERFKVDTVPQYLLFDSRGRLLHREIGGVEPEADLEERALSILAAAGAAG